MADDEYVSCQPTIQCLSIERNPFQRNPQADNVFAQQNAAEAAEIKKKRAFRKFSYRGVDLEQYDLPHP